MLCTLQCHARTSCYATRTLRSTGRYDARFAQVGMWFDQRGIISAREAWMRCALRAGCAVRQTVELKCFAAAAWGSYRDSKAFLVLYAT